MNKTLFKEEQKQKHPWVWMVIFPVMGTVIYLLSWRENNGFSNSQDGDAITGLIVVGVFMFVIMVGLTWLFFKMRLQVEIMTDGIHFRYPPFINKKKFIARKTIDRYEVRKYNPNREFRGHGVKRGLIKNTGRAYTVSGRMGLQLYLTNGDKVLIGTQRKEAILHAMEKMTNSE